MTADLPLPENAIQAEFYAWLDDSDHNVLWLSIGDDCWQGIAYEMALAAWAQGVAAGGALPRRICERCDTPVIPGLRLCDGCRPHDAGGGDDWDIARGADDLNSEHGEAILEECARIVHGMFVAETRPPLGDCEQIARAVIEHAAPFLADDARADGRAQGAAAERDKWRKLAELRRDELADHSRQAQALPKMSAMLAAQSAAYSEIADLLAGDPS